MTRRGFVSRVVAGVAASVAAAWHPLIRWDLGRSRLTTLSAAPAAAPTTIHVIERTVDPATGIAIRFVKRYDVQVDQRPSRLDVFLARPVPPTLMCHLCD